jgi:hypothetical protein
VYSTAAAREAVQDDFHDMSIQGPHGEINWDGTVHSEWVGLENVIVEVVMPGGTFGGRTPTPSENAYPGLVRLALSGA